MATNSVTKPVKTLRCFDCRAPHHHQIILINKLWEVVGIGPSYRQQQIADAVFFRPHDLLCFACIEKRLKRKLRISDLMACPANAPWIMRIWMRRFHKYWRIPDTEMRDVDYEELMALFVASGDESARKHD
jgi:hypothetical protein